MKITRVLVLEIFVWMNLVLEKLLLVYLGEMCRIQFALLDKHVMHQFSYKKITHKTSVTCVI